MLHYPAAPTDPADGDDASPDAAGTFLLSGRKQPREGGVILATAASREALEAVLAQDPFHVHGLAHYQVVEFVPSMAAPMLQGLIQT